MHTVPSNNQRVLDHTVTYCPMHIRLTQARPAFMWLIPATKHKAAEFYDWASVGVSCHWQLLRVSEAHDYS